MADPGAGPPEAICGWLGLETVSDVSSLTMRLALDVVSRGQGRVWPGETTLDVRPQFSKQGQSQVNSILPYLVRPILNTV